jgi:calcineurin-like phosphoesterase family protein
MPEVWYSSDHHFGHARIIELCDRPFRDVEHMDEELIARHNAMVAPEDTVWFLGDVALGKIRETLPLVSRMNGRKILVAGNHDRCWAGHKRVRPSDVTMYVEAGFTALFLVPDKVEPAPREAVAVVPGWNDPVVFSHMPHAGDSQDEDRHAGHRPPRHEDIWRVCGHVHEKWTVSDRQINVGVDVWDYRPVHSTELVRIMNGSVAA